MIFSISYISITKLGETKMMIDISIPNPFNGGEFRICKQITGPRGGKSWKKIYSTPATGGIARLNLNPGKYKKTWWSNGWPSSEKFEVK